MDPRPRSCTIALVLHTRTPPGCSHFHSKLRQVDGPKVTQQESKGHLRLSCSTHGSPQCSKPISSEQGRRAQSSLRASLSGAGSGTADGRRGGRSSGLCPFPLFPSPHTHPPQLLRLSEAKSQLCFLANLTNEQFLVLRPVT